MRASERVAGDGRPIIEVSNARLRAGLLEMGGTAVAYEGNVLIWIEHAGGAVDTTFVQASVGGPDRGEWSVSIPMADDVTSVLVGQEEMGEGELEGDAAKVRIFVDELE